MNKSGHNPICLTIEMDASSSLQPQDRRHERRALTLAQRGRGGASPNPLVGAVLVKNNTVIGEGWHRRCGEQHAEADALADCRRNHPDSRSLLRGSHLYVNLEPCAHRGQTPPCTEAIIEAGIGRVVVSLTDPDPRVAGNGVQRLRRAGIEVVMGGMRRQAALLNAGYLARVRRQRPWTMLKLAASIDGRTALKSGASQWISGAKSRADVQAERAAADFLLTGVGTVLADDPRLNLRPEQMPSAVRRHLPADAGPKRLILDSKLRTPPAARILQGGKTIIACNLAATTSAFRGTDTEVRQLPADSDGRPSLAAVMELLQAENCNRVMVESGPTLAGALLKAQLIDEILLYMAPLVLGSDASPLWSLKGPEAMPSPAFELVQSRKLGDDLQLRYVQRQSASEILQF